MTTAARLDAHGGYSVDLTQGTSPVEWAVEVEAAAGEVLSDRH